MIELEFLSTVSGWMTCGTFPDEKAALEHILDQNKRSLTDNDDRPKTTIHRLKHVHSFKCECGATK